MLAQREECRGGLTRPLSTISFCKLVDVITRSLIAWNEGKQVWVLGGILQRGIDAVMLSSHRSAQPLMAQLGFSVLTFIRSVQEFRIL